MRIQRFGDRNLPPILLIHGSGSSWWNYLRQARFLSKRLPLFYPHAEWAR